MYRECRNKKTDVVPIGSGFLTYFAVGHHGMEVPKYACRDGGVVGLGSRRYLIGWSFPKVLPDGRYTAREGMDAEG